MRLSLKLLLLVVFAASLSFYDTGCSSAEQTTAMLAFKAGDFEKAEREFLKELKTNPSNEEAWYYLGASRIQLGKLAAADSAFKQYRKIGKNSYANDILDAWIKGYNRGADNFEKGQKSKDSQEQLKLYKAAKEDFSICLIILPDSTIARQIVKSIDLKIAMITVTPFIDKGVQLINEEKYEDAVGEFKKAIESGIEKDNAAYETVVLDLSIAYSKWGAKLQKENPDNADAYKEKYKLALPYLEEIKNTTEKQNKLIVYQLLVAVYGNLGMNNEALEAIKIRDQLQAELDK
jgi:tetratricopeptide (TPR) repeat protein